MKDRDESERLVIAIPGVPRSSLRDRRGGALPKRVWDSRSKKLSKLEEEEPVQQICNLVPRGINATKNIVRNVANGLLGERSREPISKHWVDSLKMR
jgi:hypothetical protein